MTERIFGPVGDNFDDAIARLAAAVAKSETEAKMRNLTLEVLLNGASSLPGNSRNYFRTTNTVTME
jgi:hypothetical protein